ncbi:MAG: hypothetical protein Q4Q00_00640 [Turicibacter sp.]|nr:hypothetical protein [Turicibacter sp.]
MKKNPVKELDELREYLNSELKSKIAPIGGCKVQARYIEMADGYVTYLHIYDFPYDNPALWSNWLKPQDGVLQISIDPSCHSEEIKKKLNKTFSELDDRLKNAKKPTQINELKLKIAELSPLMNHVNQDGQFVRLTATIKLKAKTLDELQDKVDLVQEQLMQHGYKATIFLDEQLEEQTNQLRRISKRKNKRFGKIVPLDTFAGSYPANKKELSDPIGWFAGFDEDGTPVCINPFYKTEKRPSSNGLVAGVSGSGKSTYLFRMIKNHLMLGDRVRVLDPVGDFAPVVFDMGGQVLALDGSTDHALNPLAKVFAKDDTQQESALQLTLAKAQTWLSLACPTLNDYELSLFTSVLHELYKTREQVILSEVLAACQSKLSKGNLTEQQYNRYDNLVTILQDLVNNYGSLFNRYTTVNPSRANGICFLVRNLTAQPEKIKQAQFYNVLYYLWQELVLLGSEEKEKSQKENYHKSKITQTLLVIDEAHHFISPDNEDSAKFIKLFQRENRKYEGGLWFATQSILDLIKEATDQQSENMKQIFGFCQYNVIFHEKTNAKSTYSKLLGHRLTIEEIDQISNLKKGEFFLNIDGDTTCLVNSFGTYSDTDLEWMGGGK